MPTILEIDAPNIACPWNEFKPCLGASCMAWAWAGSPVERAETDNLQNTPDGPRPNGTVPAPGGINWEADGPEYEKGYHQSAKLGLPRARAQWWRRKIPRAEGSCGRVQPEFGW